MQQLTNINPDLALHLLNLDPEITTKNTSTENNPMSNEITPENPEVISDEQLEEVSGGLFDNNFCIAGQKATVNVLS